MDKRRLSALTLLKRLKKHEMEVDARRLGELRHDIALLEGQIQNVTECMQHTTEDFDATLTSYMQQYLPAAKAEIMALHGKISELQPQVLVLEEQVSEKFNEYKTFDIIYNSVSLDIKHEETLRETAEIEGTLLGQWFRRRQNTI